MLENFLSNFFNNDWVVDALYDSVKTIPFLFFVFLFIEIFEHFWADKVKGFLKASKKAGPVVGVIAASIPQCGFSVVASTLYAERFITRGTIVAVYLATSDEAIPVLLMYPEYSPYIIPLILLKLLIAIPVGYLVDKIFKNEQEPSLNYAHESIEGCCQHDITRRRKRDFLTHPIKHTFYVFVFILILTLILNYLIETFNLSSLFVSKGSFFAPLLASFLGLIPNCAVSVGLVLMFVKGTITFGTLFSGLMASGGIGLLVLFKNNKNKKDTLLILAIIIVAAFVSGVAIDVFGLK